MGNFTPSHTGRREERHSSIFLGICCYSGSADSFDCPKPIAWRHIDSKSALGSIATPNAEHAYECGTQENVLPSRISSSPLLIDPFGNLSDSGFAARDSEFSSEFEFACSANPSLVSVSIEYVAKLRGQSGSREWLLNEMCFARFNTPAQHSIGCIPTHENHGDGGVIPTHTIS